MEAIDYALKMLFKRDQNKLRRRCQHAPVRLVFSAQTEGEVALTLPQSPCVVFTSKLLSAVSGEGRACSPPADTGSPSTSGGRLPIRRITCFQKRIPSLVGGSQEQEWAESSRKLQRQLGGERVKISLLPVYLADCLDIRKPVNRFSKTCFDGLRVYL